MAENGEATPDTAAEGAQPAAAPQMRVIAQFVRDMSFENVLSQKSITGEIKPQIQVQVALDAKKRSQANQFEVSTKYTVTAKNEGTEDTIFLMELEYAGLFLLENFSEEQLHPYLMIECPRMLFPFARRIVSDTTREGGFPPVNLDTVDFVQLYRQNLANRAKAQQGNQPVS